MDLVLVTGASKGIGHAIVELLVAEGFEVLATARDAADLAELESLDHVDSCYLDVTDPDSIAALVDYVGDRPVRALVNNAGILVMGLAMTTPIDEIKKQFEVNVFGVVRMIRAFISHLHRSEGKIINIGSDSGLVSFPYTIYYNMSKFAMEALSEGLIEELKSLDISVSLIEPGNVATSIMEDAMRQLQRVDTIPVFLRDQHKLVIDRLLVATDNYRPSTTPEMIAERVLECLNDPLPERRYFEGTPSETKFAIDALLDRIVEINRTSPFGLDRDDLHSRLDFALDMD